MMLLRICRLLPLSTSITVLSSAWPGGRRGGPLGRPSSCQPHQFVSGSDRCRACPFVQSAMPCRSTTTTHCRTPTIHASCPGEAIMPSPGPYSRSWLPLPAPGSCSVRLLLRTPAPGRRPCAPSSVRRRRNRCGPWKAGDAPMAARSARPSVLGRQPCRRDRWFSGDHVNSGCTTPESWAGSDLRGSLGGGCGMEYPTEDEVRAMTNREFASLIRSQAEMIDRSLHREERLVPEVPGGPLRL